MNDGESDGENVATAAPSRRLRRVLVVLAIVLFAAAVGLTAYTWPQTKIFYTDADKIDRPADAARLRDILWQPVVRLGGLIDFDTDEYEPAISADGMMLFFVRGKAGENGDIYVRRWSPKGWGDAEPLLDINTEYDELGPEPTADGRSLYFYSDRPGGLGGYDLWVAHRKSEGEFGFEEPVNVGMLVNSEFNDYGPALTAAGDRLYFSSNRPQPEDDEAPDPTAWPGTIREDVYQRTYDLYWTPITDRGVAQARPLNLLNTPFNEGAPAVSPFGDFLYFASDRKGGEGGFDVYRSRVIDGTPTAAISLGPTVNTKHNELDPGLTMGGYTLLFSSDRPLEADARNDAPPYHLFKTVSREVYRRTETSRASIDWAAFWSAVGPNLLWALLALLLLLFLLRAVGEMRRRKLSLLARCLLASLILHLLLMLLFNVWGVTSKLAYALGKRGPIQVALISTARGGEIASQIRGEFTSVDAPTPITTEAPREPLKTEWTPTSQSVTLSAERRSFETPRALDERVTTRDATPHTPEIVVPVSAPRESPSTPETIDVVPPRESDRVAQNEAGAATLQPSAVTPQSSRPQSTHKLFVDTEHVEQVELRPRQASASLTPPQDRLTEATIVSDAVTSLPQPTVSVSKPTKRTPLVEADFPVPQEETWEAVPEPSLSLSPAVVNKTGERWNTPDIPTFSSEESPQPTAFLEPNEVSQDHLGRPFDVTPAASAVDATPRMAAVQPRSDSPRELSGVTAIDLVLPQMEVAPASTSERSDGDPLPTPPTDFRPRLTNDFFDTDADVSMASLDVAPPSQRNANIDDGMFDASQVSTRDADIRDHAGAETCLLSKTAAPDQSFLELALATEIEIPDDPYWQRKSDDRLSIVEAMGGNEHTENAVQLALQWLADHQSADGRWDGGDFDESCHECGGETDVDVEIALTGLSLLCFLAADHTHDKEGPYRDTVERALSWLLEQQSQSGDLRAAETMYSHGIATIALAEGYGMTKDSRLRDPVRRAVDFIARSRSRQTGIWRYEPGESGDTSVLGWQIMALKSAYAAGVEVPMEPFVSASHWLERVSSRKYPGLYAYQPRREVTPSMTAEGLFIQQMLGLRKDEPRMRQSVKFILNYLPDWDEAPNTYYWYYATLALFHRQGEPWRIWNEALTEQLLTNQHQEGRAAGSWDPDGEWASVGGRVYQTALCTLMLEVYYRYLPMYLQEKPPDAIGTIRGRVTDAQTGGPVSGAQVRLVLPDREPIVVSTTPDGQYVLYPTEVPQFFALSASGDRYIPQSKNVATALVAGTELALNFELQPQSITTVALEAVPDVHHLGDDAFSGSVNSQFQKKSEGDRYRTTFVLHASQLPPNYTAAVLTMLVKGVQMDHRIRINGNTLRQRLDQSPRDGSFGEFSIPVDPNLFEVGENTFEILASSLGSDVDDFEFVNIQIHLGR